MKLREFRRADAPRLFEFLKSEFPEEEAILGMRADGFERVIRRLFRFDMRVVLGCLRVLHRSPFHLYVIEEDGTIVATTLLSFAVRAGFLSTVVVAPGYRRRGFARRLLDAARLESARRGRPYVALQVLDSNTPARALYASDGFRELDRQWFVVHDAVATVGLPTPLSGPSIRLFRRDDRRPLADLANRSLPEAVREVLPVQARDLPGGSIADRLFESETASWVVDRGRGPEAHLAATSTPTTEAAHLSNPIIGPSVEPALAADLVRTATRWLAARRAVRVVARVPEANGAARRALQEGGFHDAMAERTLYRSSR